MTSHWTQMDPSWLDALESRLEERRQVIFEADLQPSDYPSFPECPMCHAVPEVIRRASDDHYEVFLSGAVITRFEPCGHIFRVDHPDYREQGEGESP